MDWPAGLNIERVGPIVVVRPGGRTAVPAPDPVQRAPHRFTVPHGAVDSHAHVVGTTFVENRSYTPPPASGGQYLGMLDSTGMTYGVLIQISVTARTTT